MPKGPLIGDCTSLDGQNSLFGAVLVSKGRKRVFNCMPTLFVRMGRDGFRDFWKWEQQNYKCA